MSDEITSQFTLNVLNGKFRHKFEPGSQRFDQNNLGVNGGTIYIGVQPETLPKGDITNDGYIMLWNVEPSGSAYVDYGPEESGTFISLGRLYPDEWAFTRIRPGRTIQAEASTANVKLQWFILED